MEDQPLEQEQQQVPPPIPPRPPKQQVQQQLDENEPELDDQQQNQEQEQEKEQQQQVAPPIPPRPQKQQVQQPQQEQEREQQLRSQYGQPQQEQGEPQQEQEGPQQDMEGPGNKKPYKRRRGLMVAAFLAPGLTKRYLQAKMMLAQFEQIQANREEIADNRRNSRLDRQGQYEKIQGNREAIADNRGNAKIARKIDNVELRQILQQKQAQMKGIQGQRQGHKEHQGKQLGVQTPEKEKGPKKRDLGAFKKAPQQKGPKGRGDM